MRAQKNHLTEEAYLVRGLPMFTALDPEALASEKAQLAELDSKGLLPRWRGYFTRTGPDWRLSRRPTRVGNKYEY